MADCLDILEVSRNPGQKETKKKRLVEQTSVKKPNLKGLNREVYALLCADNKDPAPLISSDFAISSKLGFPSYGYQKVKANLSLRKVIKWSWTPFTNPARKDGFQLHHWRKEADKNKEYPFAKMNVQINVPTYTDLEYQDHLQSSEWNKNETDYLFRMCRKYDLRFIVIHDRWDKTTYKNRTVEDLKSRYYSVCTTLEGVRNTTILTFPPTAKPCSYDAAHEAKRKEQLIKLYNRTQSEVEEERKLIVEMRKIEQRKKEREKKTQDLQKLMTAHDSTSELRKSEQHTQARNSNSRSNRKKTSSQVKNSRTSEGDALNFECASIKFPESKSSGVWLRSSRMKLPSTVGQKRIKAIEQLLRELQIERNIPATEEISQHYKELCSEIVLLYELKLALANLEFEVQAMRHQVEDSTQPGVDSKTPAEDDTGSKKISEVIDVSNLTPRKRKAAIEQVNLMRKLRKN